VFGALLDEHPFCEEVGLIVAGMTQFEHILDLIIWELSGLAQAEGSRIAAWLIGSRLRFEAIREMWLLRNGNQRPSIMSRGTSFETWTRESRCAQRTPSEIDIALAAYD
jgi:hypothetical protein